MKKKWEKDVTTYAKPLTQTGKADTIIIVAEMRKVYAISSHPKTSATSRVVRS